MPCSFCRFSWNTYSLDAPFGTLPLGILLFQIQIPCCEKPSLHGKPIVGALVNSPNGAQPLSHPSQEAEMAVKKPPDDSSPQPFETSPDKNPDFMEER